MSPPLPAASSKEDIENDRGTQEEAVDSIEHEVGYVGGFCSSGPRTVGHGVHHSGHYDWLASAVAFLEHAILLSLDKGYYYVDDIFLDPEHFFWSDFESDQSPGEYYPVCFLEDLREIL